MNHFLKPLPWDSEFFGTPVASTTDGLLPTPDNAAGLEAEMRRYGFVYHFHRLSPGQPPDIRTLSRLGFEQIDTHATLECTLTPDAPDVQSTPIRKLSLGATSPTRNLAPLIEQLAAVSRFALDPQVAAGKARDMFAIWIEKSLSGALADFVYIAGPDAEPHALVAYRRRAEGVVSLSLIAVCEDQIGGGLGPDLLNHSLAELSQDFRQCSVTASASNTRAIRFYERVGFRVKDLRHIFHAHRTPDA